MSASAVDIVLVLLLFITLPIYITVVITIIKFRKKTHFKTVFFKLVLSSAVFDFCHLSVNWVFVKFVHLRWFGLDLLVSIAPKFFAKLTSILWWYTAYGQRLGVLLVALNRVSVIAYSMEWTPNMTKLAFLIHWAIPLVPAFPQLFLQYNYSNDSMGTGLIIYWEKDNWRWFYYYLCTVFCVVEAVLCAICYGITFYKIRKHRLLRKKIVAGTRRTRSNRNQSTGISNTVEMKLAVIGFTMSILTAVCGILCAKMSMEDDLYEMMKWVPYEEFLFNIYACINPYLLLICSSDLRKHFKATLLRRNVNAVAPQK